MSLRHSQTVGLGENLAAMMNSQPTDLSGKRIFKLTTQQNTVGVIIVYIYCYRVRCYAHVVQRNYGLPLRWFYANGMRWVITVSVASLKISQLIMMRPIGVE